ncbi:12636_t:CDS:2 [Ambispora gerdemannii]|uniref:12636_t:CDS:1 n=1 Tax=Ambispora gerdemannii TaxID=144530 RepID=A0A9N9GM14_9GLOM|nr:12636_t:CDS:2 [Ambispora gerdemannii]
MTLAGSLPHLVLKEIFNEIEGLMSTDRYQILLSCALVNRHWCHEALPILWRRPLNCRREQYSKLIKVYLQFIESGYLNFLGLNLNIPTKVSFSSSSSFLPFLYPSYIKYIDFDIFFDAVQCWMTTDGDFERGKNRLNWMPQWFHRERPILHDTFFKVKRTLVQALLRSFLSSGARLKSISFSIHQNKDPNVEEFLWPFDESVRPLIANIRVLTVSGMFRKENIFAELSKICKNLQTMEIAIEGNTDASGTQSPKEYLNLGSLIQAQKGCLKSLNITLREKNRSFIELLLPSIWTNSSTLQNLRLCTADFRDVKRPLAELSSCYQLRSLEFSYCKGLTTESISPYVAPAVNPYLKRIRVLGEY